MSDKIFTTVNPNAQNCVKNVMKYLSDITYKQIITGQHTQTMAQEELSHIEKVTGKLPALVGFELLSYSPNIIISTFFTFPLRSHMYSSGLTIPDTTASPRPYEAFMMILSVPPAGSLVKITPADSLSIIR